MTKNDAVSRKEARRRRWRKVRRLIFGLMALIALQSAAFAHEEGAGLVFDVDSTGDAGDTFAGDGFCQTANGQCTLRAAIQEANAHTGADDIDFGIPTSDSGYDPATGRYTINVLTPLPDITQGVGIIGAGANKLTVRRLSLSGTQYRIFHVATDETVIFFGMTISGGDVSGLNGVAGWGGAILHEGSGSVNINSCIFTGNAAQFGGAISHVFGTMFISDSSIAGNTAVTSGGCSTGEGGGIHNNGNLTIRHSLVTSNVAGTTGGGIFNNSSIVTVIGSAISLNSAHEAGGGIFNRGGELNIMNITNSTVSFNSVVAPSACAPRQGGGIYNNGTLNITNSTLSSNSSEYGGGVANDGYYGGGTVNVKSSIIAMNTATTADPDVYGPFVSQGFNLIKNTAGSTGFTAASDITGVDPQLDPNGLQYNGGPTPTVALLSGSPARDKGVSNALTTDQRGTGYLRTVDSLAIPNPAGGDGTDIGTYEFGAHLDAFSRKMHGATNFSVPLPLVATVGVGIECRTGGAAGVHQVLAAFPSAVSLTSAKITSGIGSVTGYSANGANITVDLTGMANAQTVVITLFGVSDGSNTNNVTIPMALLLGDTNANRSVNSSDVSETKSKSGQPVSVSNFRTDVTVSNSINSSDVSIVKSKSGTALP